MKWSVYILKCADGKLYTGITSDLSRRLNEHNSDNAAGSKFVRMRRPVKMIYNEHSETRSEASKREARIKKLSRIKKLELIKKGA